MIFRRLFTLILLFFLVGFSLKAQSNYDIQLSLKSVDCNTSTVCYDVELKSSNGLAWNLAGQNYRLFYDGALGNFASGTSLLDNRYQDFSLVQDVDNQNAAGAGNLAFESNLSFLNYSIDLTALSTGGVVLPANGDWVPTSQICFDVEASTFNDPNTCFEAVWGRNGTTDGYATSFVEVSEWVSSDNTTTAAGMNYNDLDSNAGEASCLMTSCATGQPVSGGGSYDIQLALGAVDCNTNTVCYDVQLRSNGGAWDLAGQNYRLYYDGSLGSYQSGTSLLSGADYSNFTLVQDIQNQNAAGTGSLPFEDNLSFLNYTIDLSNTTTGGNTLPSNGSWLTTSQVCFAVSPTLLSDPNTCFEAVWGRSGTTNSYATSFVEVSEWVAPEDTEMAMGAGYNDLNSGDGNASCLTNSCAITQPNPSGGGYDIQLALGAVDCSNNTVCYDVQLRSNGGTWGLAGQNYRLYYDGALGSYQSGTSLLSGADYSNFTLVQDIQNQNAAGTGNLPFEDNLSFLNYTIDLSNTTTGGNMLPSNGSWLTTSQVCFAVAPTLLSDPNTCFEAVWGRSGTTNSYATSFVEVSEWVAAENTQIATGTGYNDLNSSDGEAACLANSCPTTPAGNYDIQLALGAVDCSNNTVCYDVQLRSNGGAWGLAGQNYRLYYDGALGSYQSGSSLLGSADYSNFTLVEDIQNQNATGTGNLPFEDNLSFLNYTIDLSNTATGGNTLPSNGSWLTTSQVCFAVSPTLLSDPNTCFEAVWGRSGTTNSYATSFVEVAEWVAPENTQMANGVGYDDLNSNDGEASCFTNSCPTTPAGNYDIQLSLDAVDCNNNTVCYDVQLRSNGGAWGLAGQNYRLYYDGSLGSYQSGISLLGGANYDDFTLVQDIQNQNAAGTGNLPFENNISFLNYTIDLSNTATGGSTLPSNGGWLTTSQLCFAVDPILLSDPNTCFEAVWGRMGQTDAYATSFVEVAEWVSTENTQMANGVGYDDLNSNDGEASCFANSCVATGGYGVQLNLNNFDCTSKTACYDVQVRSTSGDAWGLAGQNYRLYYDGSLGSYQSGTSLLGGADYGAFTLVQDVQNQNAAGTGNLAFENTLSFLNYTIDLENTTNGGVDLGANGAWLSTSQVCFQLADAVVQDPNVCFEAIWARDNVTSAYATSFVEVAQWIGTGNTQMSTGTQYNNLENGNACFADYATVYENIDAQICQGSSYTFNGQSLTVGDTYVANLTTTNGCEKVVTLNLEVIPVPILTTRDIQVCGNTTVVLSDLVNGSSNGVSFYPTQTDAINETNETENTLLFPTTQTYYARLNSAASNTCFTIEPISVVVNNCTFDLALEKSVVSNATGSFKVGDIVDYNITVQNQGAIPAYNITVNDYPQSGLNFNSNLNPNWTSNNGGYQMQIPGPLASGEQISVGIRLIIDANFQGSTLDNIAEIIFAGTSPNDLIISADDFDSTPSNGVAIEDDQDNALISLEICTPTSAAITADICEGDSYFFNGQVYALSGVYNAMLTNARGCDSITTLTLNVIAVPKLATQSTNICPGDALNLSSFYNTGSVNNLAYYVTWQDAVNNVNPYPATVYPNRPISYFVREIGVGNCAGIVEVNVSVEDCINQSYFDLALLKSLPPNASKEYQFGETVTFNIELYNQGTETAYNVELVDYVPEGLTLTDSNWAYNGSNRKATFNVPVAIPAGTNLIIPITFVVNSDFTGNLITNAAEIRFAANSEGGSMAFDLDSQADDVNGDRAVPDFIIHPDDEDDHDIANIIVTSNDYFDLALSKKIAPTQSFNIGPNELVEYDITVFNQGTIDAYNIIVEDFVPANLLYSSAENTAQLTGNPQNWSANSTYVIPFLKAKESTTVRIRLRTPLILTDDLFINVAEITSASDVEFGGNIIDIDSAADAFIENDIFSLDDEITGEFGDEDDHDFAAVANVNTQFISPQGFIYCDKTGDLMQGGTIQVFGPGAVFIVDDGTNGSYQWFTDGTPGIYTMTYLHPDGYSLSTTCGAQSGALDLTNLDGTATDRDGTVNGQYILGSGQFQGSPSTFCGQNPYYTSFDLSSGDPSVAQNNLPVSCSEDCPIPAIIQEVLTICQGEAVQLDATVTSTKNLDIQYSWTPSIGLSNAFVANPTANPSVSTTYIVEATLAGTNCSNYDTVRVNVSSQTLNGGADQSICQGGTANLNATGGLNYIWSPTTGLSNSTIANPTANPSVTTTYTVRSITAKGCISTDQVTVFVNGAGQSLNTGSNQSICQGGTASLNVTGGLNYTWSPTAGLSNPNIGNPTASPSATTTYTISSTTAQGCTSTGQVTVFVNGAGQALNTGANQTICQGGTASLNITGGTNYTWSPTAGLSNPNIGNPTASPLVTTTYTVRSTTAQGCTSTGQVTVFVNSSFQVIGCPDKFICGDKTTARLVVNGGVSWVWSPSTGLDDPFSPAPIASPSQTTIYTVTGTDANGCTASDEVVVSVGVAEMDAGNNQTICQGGTAFLNALGGINYTWSPTTGLSNPSISNPSASPSSTTTYTVTSTNAVGCPATDQVTVFVDNNNASMNAGADQNICQGGTAFLNAIGGTNYTWSPTSGLNNASISNPSASPSSTTTYTVTSTTSAGCTVTDQVTVFVDNNNGSMNAGTDQTICRGGTAFLNVTGGVSYTWSPTSGLNNASISNPTASPNTTTTYTVTSRNQGGCTATDQITVFVENAAMNAGTDQTICAGSRAFLNATGGTNYTWSPTSGLNSASIASPTASPSSTTTYTVTSTTSAGCTATDQITVFVENVGINAGTDQTICVGSRAFLNATGGVSYSWSPTSGLNNASIANPTASPGSTTIYTVTSTTSAGCTSTDQVTVFVDRPVMNAGADQTICSSSTASLNATGGVSYTWIPTTGLSNPTIANPVASPSSTMTYTVTTTTSSGCTATDQVTVNVQNFEAHACEDKTVCIGESIQLVVSSGASYQWSPASTLDDATSPTPVANPGHTTTYSVTVTAENGCTSEDEVTLYVNYNSIADAGLDVSECPNAGAFLNASGGVSYEWSPRTGLDDPFSATPFANPTTTTTYTVTVTDFNGCVATDEMVYTISPGDCLPSACKEEIVAETEICRNTDNIARICLPYSIEYLNANYTFSTSAGTIVPDHGCNFVPLYAYPYAILPNLGNSGTYTIESWIVNGIQYSGVVRNVDELAAWMQAQDPSGNWTKSSTSYFIQGGNPSSNYGVLSIMHEETWIEANLTPSYTGLPQGTKIEIDMTNRTTDILTITNKASGCIDEVRINNCTVPFVRCGQQAESVYEETISDCRELATVCLPINSKDIFDYDILVNGSSYAEGFQNCSYVAAFSYAYFALPNQGKTGPYEVSKWTINGEEFSGSFSTLSELVVWMNDTDVAGNWVLDPSSLLIKGDLSTNTYGSLEVLQVSTGAMGVLEINRKYSTDGTQLKFTEGTHLVTLRNIHNGCTEEFEVVVTCVLAQAPHADVHTVATNSEQEVVVDLTADSRAEELLIEIIEPPVHGRVIVNLDNTVSYEANEGYCDAEVADRFTYRICNSVGCDEAEIEVFVKCPSMQVNTGFSPNNDGINDYLTIEGLEYYPENKLQIFNRWGTIIFKATSYDGGWDGSLDGLPLPDGTYFYILEDGQGEKQSGYIQINK